MLGETDGVPVLRSSAASSAERRFEAKETGDDMWASADVAEVAALKEERLGVAGGVGSALERERRLKLVSLFHRKSLRFCSNFFNSFLALVTRVATTTVMRDSSLTVVLVVV
jgi:hypothetical protein